jgi:hypothetical protein
LGVLVAARAIEPRRLEDGADDVQESATMDPEIRAYYENGVEHDRLTEGSSRIEYERTKELLERHLLGPLDHLTDRGDRLTALREACRVLRVGGFVAAAAISRFASVLDGLYAGYLSDPTFERIVERDLADGQHRIPGDADQAYFTTAFFHRPDELSAEVEEAGFAVEGMFGVEGPGWLLADRWEDPVARPNILRAAHLLEQEPSVIGASSHLLAIGRVR